MSRLRSTNEMRRLFGDPKTIEDRLVFVNVPKLLPLYILPNIKILRIRSHPKCALNLELALHAIANSLDSAEVAATGFNLFGGSYVNRNMRGSSKLSAHAFGVAFDFSPLLNGLRVPFGRASFSTPTGLDIIDIFKTYDFVNYGQKFGFDAMHFEFNP